MNRRYIYLVCICIMALVACGDDPIAQNDDRSTSLMLSVKDDKGNPIADAGFYYTCVTQLTESCDLGSHLTTLHKDTISTVKVAPLPATQQTFLGFSVQQSDNYSIKLLDYNKNLLNVIHSGVMVAGEFTIGIPVESNGKILPSCVYYVELKNSKTTVYKKIVFETFSSHPVNTIIPNFTTSSSGELEIPYTSVPFAEQFRRADETATVYDYFTTIGNIIRFTIVKEGYKPYIGTLTIGSLQTPTQLNIVLQQL